MASAKGGRFGGTIVNQAPGLCMEDGRFVYLIKGQGMDFHRRFNIYVAWEEAERRFINRAVNVLIDKYLYRKFDDAEIEEATRLYAYRLGETFRPIWIGDYLQNDFHRCLILIEVLYTAASVHQNRDSLIEELNKWVSNLLISSEVDLGIRWENGKFQPAGVKSLDERLINDPLQGLREAGYETVIDPFEKGLQHFLDSGKRAELHSDVITDMYEAVEAMAKIVTGRNKDLSANAEMFLSKSKAPSEFKPFPKDYIAFANEFRHAADESKSKPEIKVAEVEYFVYLSGMFIRYALKSAGR
jgi:hypothetical protein